MRISVVAIRPPAKPLYTDADYNSKFSFPDARSVSIPLTTEQDLQYTITVVGAENSTDIVIRYPNGRRFVIWSLNTRTGEINQEIPPVAATPGYRVCSYCNETKKGKDFYDSGNLCQECYQIGAHEEDDTQDEDEDHES